MENKQTNNLKEKETKKDVYEDVKKMIEKADEYKYYGCSFISGEELLEEINKKLGEEKLTSQKDGDKN